MADGDGGTLFTGEAAERIAGAVNWVEGHLGAPLRDKAPPRSHQDVFIARTTSGTADGNGNYPAVITLYDASIAAWVDYGAVKIRPANGEILSDATRYSVKPAGESGGDAIYTFEGAPSQLAVEDQSGTPRYNAVGIIQIVATNGLVLTNPSSGTVRLDLALATTAQIGVVSVTAQTFAGLKTFRDDIECGDAASVVGAVTLYPGRAVTSRGYVQMAVGSDGTQLILKDASGFFTYWTLQTGLGLLSCPGANAAYWIADVTASTFSGKYGTDALGNVFKGGICTTVGTGTVSGTGTVTSIDVSGGTTGLTTSGGPVTTSGTITLAGRVNVAHGGTDLTAVTAHHLLVGAGTSALTLLAPSATSGVPLISQGSSADPAYGTAVVAGGGTGATGFTAYSVVCAGTTSTGALQNVSGVGTAGQALISQGAGSLPHWSGIDGGTF